MMVCMYCGASEDQPHGPFGCPADPETQKVLIEKFGPMAAIGNPYIEEQPKPLNGEIRPWGWFEILAENRTVAPFWKLKKIVVNPHQQLSFQSHKHRREFWTVIKGHGRFHFDGIDDPVNGQVSQWNHLDLNSTAFIAENQIHSLGTSSEGIEIIELAVSDTHPIDESDITRYKDRYGRV